MAWPTWQQGLMTAVLSGLMVVLLRRARPGWWVDAARPTFAELSLLAGLYSLWRMARYLPLATSAGAIRRGRQIDRLERWLHLPSELSLQHLALDHELFGRFLNVYYATLHVPVTICFLVWLFARHRDQYGHWRNGLAILTGACLFIRFVRVAPPRFLPDLGYIDLASAYGLSVYGPVGTGVSDQFAAMPSIHVGWAAVVSFGVVAASSHRWRGLALAHVTLTMLAVSATGNHWWLDGIVAIVLLGIGLWADDRVRGWLRRRLGEPAMGPAQPAPATVAAAGADVG